jgi:phosphoadenosine phosphosulfate reductase
MKEKITKTIEKIQKAESLALELSPNGFYLNFSGGKDSIVLYDLVKKSGVKYSSHMQLTTVDPPELLKFVKENYPSVELHKPKHSMFQLIRKKKQLPLRMVRYCCAELKEFAGVGFLNLLGIRREESTKRAKRNEIEISNYRYSNSLDQFNIDKEIAMKCISGKDKLIFSPILDWTYSDVWNYIRCNKLLYPDLYDKGYYRIGCIFCPMASTKSKHLDLKNYPKFANAYKKAIQYCIDSYGYGSNYTTDANELFDWYLSNKSMKEFFAMKKQLSFDFHSI